MSVCVLFAALCGIAVHAAIVADARWNPRFTLIDPRDSRRSFTQWGGLDPLAGAAFEPRQLDGDDSVWECLGVERPAADSSPPYAELFAHFRQIFDATAPFRALQWHAYGGNDHRGPWLENHWMRSFLRRPFAWWYPYVPVFVQLTDASAHGYHGPARRWLEETLRGIHWRRDVVYVIVTQYDTGPLAIVPDPAFFSNFLVFSAGGWGNVPLPLLNGRVMRRPPNAASPLQPPSPFPPPATRVLSFAGRSTYAHQAGIPEQYHVLRVSALASLRERLPVGVLRVQEWQPTDAWLLLTSESLLTLAFRGYGATSFRLYEALHLGSVPVYVWSNLRWLPYRHAREALWGPGGVAFVVEASDFGRWVDRDLCRLLLDGSEPVRESNAAGARLCSSANGGMPQLDALAAAGAFTTNSSTVARMRQRLGDGSSVLQRYFTFEAVMRHVHAFLVHPGRSELACERKPEVRNE